MFACIKAVTFNCKNFKSSVDEIRELCQSHDLIFLQETWLLDSELTMLSQVDCDFSAQGVSTMDTNNQLITGRPYGGLAILWAKKLGQCKPVIYKDSKHFMALEISVAGVTHIFVNVYMPYCYSGNLDLFLSCLSEIDTIISSASTPYVYFMGDFNSDVHKDHHLFGAELKSFCNDVNIVISDTEWLHDCYTFLSSAHNTVSWLDHVICTNSAHHLLIDFEVLYDKVTSDHFPMSVVIDIQHQSATPVDDFSKRVTKVFWDKLSAADIDEFKKKY